MIDNLTLLNEFHFIRPAWLWAIIPLLIVVGLIRYVHRQQSGWQSVLANHLYNHLITTDGIKKTRPPLFLLGFCWVLATIALAGPTWERLPQPVYQLNTGKVVLLDMSLSMRATDVKPDRLTRAKYKAIDLVTAITEGETGLVAYAGDAFTISPLSSDAQNLTTLIPSLTPEIMPIPGSEPALGLEAAINLLNNAGYRQGEIFWITDGISNQQMKEASEILNASTYRLSILAVGSEDGAPIQLPNGELMKDSRGSIVLPKLTTSNLKSLASKGGGRYAPMQTNDSDISYLVKQTSLEQDKTEKTADEEQENFGDKWHEMGPYLLLLLLPLAAYSFRRGIVTCILLIGIVPIYSPNAQAGWWQDMWETPDQQAMQNYRADDYAKAAEKFKNPLWQGSAHYRNKNYEDALASFSQIDDSSPSYPEAMYNTGNALAQLGEIDKAIEAYNQVLEKQPNHADALANKKLLEDLKQQQQQNQDQSDEQQQGEQQNDQQQNNEQQDGQQSNENNEESQREEQQGNNSEQDASQDSNSSEGEEEQGQTEEQEETKQKEQEKQVDAKQEEGKEAEEKQAQALEGKEQEELTDEQKEQLQRMQKLLNRVPDDPAFLLKRKMQIESQKRRRERLPTSIKEHW